MAVRIPWNEYEEAVLLQSLIDILDKKTERKQAKSDVSKCLRKMAVAHGINIDDKFRNENGIKLQMSFLEYAYTGGKTGLPAKSGWYFDIVEKYKNDRGAYEELLLEVKKILEGQSDNKTSFQTWLENTEPKKKALKVIASLGIIDVLLRKNKVINVRLFEIDNPKEIENLILNIKQSKGVRLHSKNTRSNAISGLTLYKEFLETSNVEENGEQESTDNELKVVSFTDAQDYAFTRPVSLEYFGKNYPEKNWTELYVQTVSCFYRDYPDEIDSLIEKNIGGRGRVDIAGADSVEEMVAPKEFEDGLFLETNCSATGIIKKITQLMDICGVDYSNISITYVPKGSTYSNPISSKKIIGKPATESDSDFYNWLTEHEGLAAPTGRSYSSAINNCDAFCKEHSIGTGRIYGTESIDELDGNIGLLLNDEEFQAYNDQQHHRFTAALAKYRIFMGLDEGVAIVRRAAKPDEKEINVDPDELAKIKETLQLPRFEYGFKDDGVELYRFRASYEEVNGSDCPLDDDVLLDSIRGMGFEFDGKVYLISDDSMKSIADEIDDYRDQGVNIVYYESLYDLKSYEYFDAKIVSEDMLKAILKHLMPRLRYKNNYFALDSERQTELELIRNDIIRVWGSNTLQTFDELSLKLPLIPIDKIKFTLAQQSAFVWNSAETYMQAEWFEADEDEIERLGDYIDEQCEEHGGVSLDEIPFDHLNEANPEISETALNTCFCKLVEDRFEKNARMLTRKGASKDTYTAVIEFCREQDKCTYDRLEYIAKRVAGTIRRPDIIEAANAVMVRVDKNDFIVDRLIQFDTDRIDAALDYVVTDDFIGMREITTFSTFPFCGYGWNLYLLESYCRRFSKKYKYETRRANSSNSGAIVVKSCSLNYHDIMTQAVARSGRELQQNEVFDFLTEAGYMERKKYSDIDSLINEAAQLRERRK